VVRGGQARKRQFRQYLWYLDGKRKKKEKGGEKRRESKIKIKEGAGPLIRYGKKRAIVTNKQGIQPRQTGMNQISGKRRNKAGGDNKQKSVDSFPSRE